MFCNKCGNQIPDGCAFCGQCGTPVAKAPAQPEPQPVAENPVAEIPVDAGATTILTPEMLQQAAEAVPQYDVPQQPAEAVPQYDVPQQPYLQYQAPQQPVQQQYQQYQAPQQPVQQYQQYQAPQQPVQQYQQYQAPQQPVQQQYQQYQAPQQPAFAQFEAPKPKKKGKKALGILLAVLAILVAGAVAVGMFWEPLQGTMLAKFGSGEDYLNYVEKKSMETVSDTLSSGYGSITKVLSAEPASGASEVNLKLTVGDKVITLLEDLTKQSIGQEMKLDWLNSIDLNMSVNAKESLNQIGMALNINQTEIAKLDMILNMDKGELFLGVLSLSEKYLKAELDLPAGNGPSVYGQMMDLLSDEALQKALPTEDEVDALLDKYIGIVLDNLKDVEKGSETVNVGGISQKLTTLKININQKTVMDVATAILESAKDDAQIKKIINNMAKYLEDNDLIEDADDVYGNFQDSIKDALDAAEDAEIEDDAFKLTLTNYVNSSHEIVGRKIKVDGEELLRYIEVQSGDKIAFEMEAATLEITGEGTEKKGVVNAVYTFFVENRKICDITFVDFRADDENLNGKIRIAPSSELMGQMGLDSMAASGLALADLQLELGFETTKTSSKIELNLLSGKDTLFGITLTTKETTATPIKQPDEKDVVSVDNIDQWLETLDVLKLLKNVEDATGLKLTDILTGGLEIELPTVSGGNNIFGGSSSTAETKAPTQPSFGTGTVVTPNNSFGTGTAINPTAPTEYVGFDDQGYW